MEANVLMGFRVFKRLQDLLDVNPAGLADGDVPTWDAATSKFTMEAAGGGGSFQPLDSDLTAIAALSTTAFGRGLLILADQAALLSAAGAAAASHAHSGDDITSGTVADARIAGTIARDSEVSSAIAALSTVYQPLDSDLTAVAALSTTAFGRSLLEAANAAALRTLAGVVIGTDVPGQAAFDDHSGRHEDGGADEISLAGLSGTPAALSDHLADTSDAHDASAISFSPTGSVAATDVQAAIAEVASEASGIPATLLDAKGDLIVATAADTPARLAVGATDGMVPTVQAAQAAGLAYLLPPGFEFDYAQDTTAQTISATSEASPADVVSLPARTYDGSTTIIVEFFCAAVVTGSAATVVINLWDASTDLGRLAVIQSPGAGSLAVGVSLRRRLTPSAASHTYKVRAWRITANGTIDGSSPRLPMFIRAVKV